MGYVKRNIRFLLLIALNYIVFRSIVDHDMAVVIISFIFALGMLSSNVVDIYKLYKANVYIKSDLIYLTITTVFSIVLASVFLPIIALPILLVSIVVFSLIYIFLPKLGI